VDGWLLRFQEGAETFDQFKLQHERLLKKVDGLRQAKDMAEEKSKAKTLFLANTCHELVRTDMSTSLRSPNAPPFTHQKNRNTTRHTRTQCSAHR
jgi:hypothetical protein